jgi:hypothetical protein
MEFYSFRFGEMKTVQADAASPKLIALEMELGFKAPEHHTVESLALKVHVPHDPNQTVVATQEAAYRAATALLRAAADHCTARTAGELCEETERRKAFAVTSST